MPEISDTISKYDIGLYMLQPNTFNQKWHCLIKFLNFIQARLAIAIWPSQEMVKNN